MKKIVTAGALLASMSGVALAADLPARLPPPPPPPLPVFTWTGPYFGINGGYAFDHDGRFDTAGNQAATAATITAGNRPARVTDSSDGFTVGGQIGFNYQLPGLGFGGLGGPGGGIVVGVEADADYVDLSSSRTYVGGGLSSNFRDNSDFLGTFRGRIGYAFGQFLVYGTGGLAFGETDIHEYFANAVGGPTTFFGRRNRIDTGYAYGGGFEYALPANSFLNFFHSSAVTFKAEYLHYDLGRSTITVAGLPTSRGSYTSRVTNDTDVARVGINYKFGTN